MDSSTTPITRRELRQRASAHVVTGTPVRRRDLRAARRRPSAPARLLEAASRVALPPSTGPGRHATSRRALHRRSPQWPSVLGPAPAFGLAVAVLVMVTGVGLVHADLDAQLRQARATALADEAERRDRVDEVAAERLTAEAAAFATQRRDEALSVAVAALEKAETVVTVAADVVDAETMTPLDEAIADLTELVAISPVPEPAVIDTDDVEPVENVDVDAAAGVEPEQPTEPEQPAQPEQPAEPETDRPQDAEPVEAGPQAPGTVPVPEALLPDGPHSDLIPRPRLARDRLQGLDLDVSARMLVVAAELASLAENVEAEAEAEIAAAEAAAAERAARRAAAVRAAAEELARVVAAADAAPNGAIPANLLCGVDFASGVQLRCDAAPALEELNTAYRAHFGRDLTVVSSYRDLPTQETVKATRGGLAATPGTSQHGRGLAVDLAGFGRLGEFTAPSYVWMKANAERFGWVHPSFMGPGGRGPQEPWHWEYHG